MIAARARTLLSTYYAMMLEYRAELVLWALANSLPFILMGVWYQASTTGQFSLTPTGYAQYFLAVFVVRQVTVVWVIWEFEHDVVHGTLAFQLVQPLDPIWRHVAMHVSERAARFPFALILVVAFFLAYPDAAFVPSWQDVALAAIAMSLAFALRFWMQYTFALAAFWTERASAIEQLWMLPYLFLSGLIAPLSDFPPIVEQFAYLTPFPYLVHVPASLLLGKTAPIGQAVVVIVAWFIGFGVLNRLLWRAGLRRFSAMGG